MNWRRCTSRWYPKGGNSPLRKHAINSNSLWSRTAHGTRCMQKVGPGLTWGFLSHHFQEDVVHRVLVSHRCCLTPASLSANQGSPNPDVCVDLQEHSLPRPHITRFFLPCKGRGELTPLSPPKGGLFPPRFTFPSLRIQRTIVFLFLYLIRHL